MENFDIIYEFRLLAKKLSNRNFALVFVANTLIINIISFFLIYVLSGSATMTLSPAGTVRVSYALSFLVIASVVTALVVFLERLYFYRFRIKISEISANKPADKRHNDGER